MPVPHIRERRVSALSIVVKLPVHLCFGRTAARSFEISVPNSGSLGTMYFQGMLTLRL